MTKITVLNGALYQWDTGRKVQVETSTGTLVSEVHFSDPLATNAYVVVVDAPGNVVTASVPDILLQTFGTLTVYAVVANEDGRRTKHARSFTVAGRSKPDDYVYTEEEILTYHRLEKRLDEVEKNGVSDEQVEVAVAKYLDKNPIDVLPPVTEADDGKVLTVVDGAWMAGDLPKYDGAYEVTPLADETTTLETAQKFMDANVVVNKVPYYETSNTDGGETVYIATEVDIYGD